MDNPTPAFDWHAHFEKMTANLSMVDTTTDPQELGRILSAFLDFLGPDRSTEVMRNPAFIVGLLSGLNAGTLVIQKPELLVQLPCDEPSCEANHYFVEVAGAYNLLLAHIEAIAVGYSAQREMDALAG